MKTPRSMTEFLFAGQGYCASHLDGAGAGPAGIGCAACVRWAMEELVQHAIAAEKARADEAEKKVNFAAGVILRQRSA
jgi:hypothetical protein